MLSPLARALPAMTALQATVALGTFSLSVLAPQLERGRPHVQPRALLRQRAALVARAQLHQHLGHLARLGFGKTCGLQRRPRCRQQLGAAPHGGVR